MADTPGTHLDYFLSLSQLLQEGRVEFSSVLRGIRGSKSLIIDPQLKGVVNQIISYDSTVSSSAKGTNVTEAPQNFLKENAVQFYRELKAVDETESFTELFNSSSNSGSGSSAAAAKISENTVYLVRASLPLMRLIAQHIRSATEKGVKTSFHICFVPAHSTVCEQLLEEHIKQGSREGANSGSVASVFSNAWDKISFCEMQLGLIPFDSDILSLEINDVFKQCFVDGDISSLNIVALALLQLQNNFGLIPNIKSKGLGAKKVLQKLFRLRARQNEDEREGSKSQFNSNSNTMATSSNLQSLGPRKIHTLIVIDREVDLISPLVTPLTYEGLLDDLLGIESGTIKLEAGVLGDDKGDEMPLMAMKANPLENPPTAMCDSASKKSAALLPSSLSGAGSTTLAAAATTTNPKKPNPTDLVTIPLSNSDAIFADIRDLSIERLGAYMQDKAIHIRERYNAFRENKDASITEIHDFVKKIPKLTKEFKSLNQHINIAALLKQKTDTKEFRDQWQGERAMLEGESFLDEIEERLYADSADRCEMLHILRLLCIQSLTQGGIKANKYDSIRRAFSHIYGFQHLFTLTNLERAGLIRRKETMIVDTAVPVWQTLRKHLRLIDERANVSIIPDDISYVSAGYAPMLVRLVQMLIGSRHSAAVQPWSASQAVLDAMKLLPGPWYELTQHPSVIEELADAIQRSQNQASLLAGLSAASPSSSSSFISPLAMPHSLINYTTGLMSPTANADFVASNQGAQEVPPSFQDFDDDTLDENNQTSSSNRSGNESQPSGRKRKKEVLMVLVVGGLSFMEIASFRFLSKDPNFPFTIITATTKLISGASFIGSIQHDFS